MTKRILPLLLLFGAAVGAGTGKLQTRLDKLMGEVRFGIADVDPADESTIVRLKRGDRAARELRALLRQHPEGWKHVRAGLRKLPAGERAGDVRIRLLDVLVCDEDPGSRRFVSKRLETAPADVSVDAVLHLAESSAHEAARTRLGKMVRPEPHMGSVYPAAFLGLRGDKEGVAVLRWFVEDERMAKSNLEMYVAAAAGLYALGETEPWKGAMIHLDQLMADADKARQQRFSKWLRVLWKHFKKVPRKGPAPRLAFLQERIRAEAASDPR